jgi:hypothetical protein
MDTRQSVTPTNQASRTGWIRADSKDRDSGWTLEIGFNGGEILKWWRLETNITAVSVANLSVLPNPDL